VPHEEAFDHLSRVPVIPPEISEETCRAAALTVAHNATSVTDCAQLLEMLGLRKQVQA
jgi:hypothetical protein